MATATPTTALRKMDIRDLRLEITRKRESLAKIRLGIAMGKEKNTSQFKKGRRELAQMLTVLRDMEKQSAQNLNKTAKTSTVSSQSASDKKAA